MTNVTLLVHNRPRLTEQCLLSIADTPNMNLTVLDDASDPETRGLLVKLQKEIPFALYRNEESAGTGAARNQAIRLSETHWGRGDYLYLSDNDVWMKTPLWLDVLVHCYEEARRHGFKVLGAYNHPYHIPVNHFQVTPTHMVDEVQALALQSMIMTWDVWDECGPFRETPPGRVCMGEDVEFGWAIAKDGGKLGVVSPALLVNTGITNSFGEKIPGWELVKSQAPEGVYVE